MPRHRSLLIDWGLQTERAEMACSMLFVACMSKMVFEVRQKDGSLVTARLGATNHTEEAHMGLADLAIGGILFIITAGFVFFLLML